MAEWELSLKSAESDALALIVLQKMDTVEEAARLDGQIGALGEALQVVLSRGFVASAVFLFEKNPSGCHHLLVCLLFTLSHPVLTVVDLWRRGRRADASLSCSIDSHCLSLRKRGDGTKDRRDCWE